MDNGSILGGFMDSRTRKMWARKLFNLNGRVRLDRCQAGMEKGLPSFIGGPGMGKSCGGSEHF